MTVTFTDIEYKTPVWIIAAAVAAGTAVFLVLTGVLLCCIACIRKWRRSSKPRKSPSTDVVMRTWSCFREETVSQTSTKLSRPSIADRPRINPSLISTNSTSSFYSSSPTPPPRTNTRNSSATPKTTTETRRESSSSPPPRTNTRNSSATPKTTTETRREYPTRRRGLRQRV